MVSKITNKNYIHEDNVIRLSMESAGLSSSSDYFGLSAFYMKSRNKKLSNSASYLRKDLSMTELIAQFAKL